MAKISVTLPILLFASLSCGEIFAEHEFQQDSLVSPNNSIFMNFETNESKWVCSGYCFLGGDLPTNPWRPISSEGATEQEARDNLDCDPYMQSGVGCGQVQ